MPQADSNAASSALSDPELEGNEYRPISTLAVLALVAALASPLALLAPECLAVPGVALLLAASAWRTIGARREVLSGSGLALFAGCLAGAVLGGTIAYRMADFRRVEAQAREFSESWLKTLAGDSPQSAFDLTVGSGRDFMSESGAAGGQPPGGDGETEQPQDPKVIYQQGLADFLKQPMVQAVRDQGAGGQIRFVETAAVEPQSAGRRRVVQGFSVGAVPVILQVERRRVSPKSPAVWRVVSINPPGPSGAPR